MRSGIRGYSRPSRPVDLPSRCVTLSNMPSYFSGLRLGFKEPLPGVPLLHKEARQIVLENGEACGRLLIETAAVREWIDGASAGSGHTSTIKDESEATTYLAGKLKQDRDLKKDDAEAECKRFGLSKRGFLNRVWPDAREKAGLPAIAPPGRKKQKNQNA
jgi:hypothetical protein